MERVELVGLGADELLDAGVWGLVIWGIVALFRRPADRWPGGGRAARPDPERILAERFASGEIDEQDYHRRLHTLRLANGRPADLSR